MAYKGNQPYDFRLSAMESQSSYHADDICGSSFHGLATSIELKLKNYDYQSARKQVLICINARKYEMSQRRYPDPAHNRAIVVMEDLLRKINNLILNINTLNKYLPTAIVRYNEQKGYRIILDRNSKPPQELEQELEQQNYQRFLKDQEEGEEYDPTHIYIGGKIQRQRQRQKIKTQKNKHKTQKDKHKIKHKLTRRNKRITKKY